MCKPFPEAMVTPLRNIIASLDKGAISMMRYFPCLNEIDDLESFYCTYSIKPENGLWSRRELFVRYQAPRMLMSVDLYAIKDNGAKKQLVKKGDRFRDIEPDFFEWLLALKEGVA